MIKSTDLDELAQSTNNYDNRELDYSSSTKDTRNLIQNSPDSQKYKSSSIIGKFQGKEYENTSILSSTGRHLLNWTPKFFTPIDKTDSKISNMRLLCLRLKFSFRQMTLLLGGLIILLVLISALKSSNYKSEISEYVSNLDESEVSEFDKKLVDEILSEETEEKSTTSTTTTTTTTTTKTTPKPTTKRTTTTKAPQNVPKIPPKNPFSQPCQTKLAPKNTFQIIPLLSFPGSGNTWSRYLIEQSTGYYTGSVYRDKRLSSTMKGEMLQYTSGETVVQKTHGIMRVRYPKSCVFIMRDPKDAILSNFALELKHSHSKPLTEEDLKTELWEKSHKRTHGFISWFNTYETGLARCKNNVFMIKYEEIKNDLTTLLSTMSKLVKFINLNNPKFLPSERLKFRENCVKENNEGLYHRPHKDKIDVGKFLTLDEKIIANQKIVAMNKSFVAKLGEDFALPDFYLFDLPKEHIESKVIENESHMKTTTTPAPKTVPTIKEEPKEDQCQATLGKNHQFKTIVLLSFPGSGNTWSRFLIEQATGFVTGSGYSDGRLAKVLIGEKEDIRKQNTIVVKTHGLGRITSKTTPSGCVFIIRNPKDAILSDFALDLHHSHKIPVTDEDMRSSKWAKFGKRVSGFYGWAGAYKESNIRGACKDKVSIIWYEKIKESVDNLVKNIGNVVDFINDVNLSSPSTNSNATNFYKTPIKFRKNCLIQHNEGSFHRKYSKKINIDKYFTPDEKVKANAVIRNLNETLVRKLGKENEIPVEYYFDI